MIKFENPSNGRYYYLSIQKDLLHPFVIIIMRGGRESHTARIEKLGYENELDAKNKLDNLAKRRLSRGYIKI